MRKENVLIAVIAVTAGLLIGRGCKDSTPSEVIRHHTTTVTRRHTDTLVKVVFYPRYISERVIDSIPCPIGIAQRIPISQRYYKGDSYEAWVSGYNPKIDSLRVYATKETIELNTVTVKEIRSDYSRWSIGLGVGYGWNGRWSPYIGVTANYSLIRFKKKHSSR